MRNPAAESELSSTRQDVPPGRLQVPESLSVLQVLQKRAI